MINLPLPEAFVSRMKSQLGEEFTAFLDAMNDPPVRGIRLNSMKPAAGLERFREMPAVSWAPDAYELKADSAAGSMVLHEAGAFYLQEPGAMMPAAVLDAKPGETILDLCAAPGGKSTQIGIAMRGQGLLVCNEPIAKRARILSGNIERIGLPNTVVTCAWPEQLAERWPEGFDAVMADAPCSGEGMFRRVPESRSEWTPERSEGCAQRQREILKAAAGLVRPGGRLIYSTCTYNPQENEDNAEWFLREHPDFEAEAFRIKDINAPDGMYICYPHRLRCEGQFAAKFRRKGEAKAVLPPEKSLPKPDREEIKTMNRLFPMLPQPSYRFGKTLVYLPECPDLTGINALRVGLHLAEIRGKAAVPDHAAAMSVFPPEITSVNLDGPEAQRYLAGETTSSETEGWLLLRYNGLVLGWGKGNGGMIKNHYPKGLRRAHSVTDEVSDED